MFECATCGQKFYDSDECGDHMDTYDHWAKCKTCEMEFSAQRLADTHMKIFNHWPTYECETCPMEFDTNAARDKHMRELDHFDRYCPDCDRYFMNNNNLRMHLNSKMHRGTLVHCPCCNTAFGTASGACTHLESGACPGAPGVNRESLYKFVREKDRDGFLTNNLIGWKEDQECTKWEVNPNTHNGSYWECYFCHRQFNTASSLSSHLNSPVHKQKIYHCPNKRGNCNKQFITLAGLFAHLESESCGLTRFENVQKEYQNVLTGRGLLTS
ncbi:unnamed protein product [Penicillium manginii]